MKNIIFIKTKIGNFSIDVELNLVEGINCLFGPSGAGKTSIINCVAGLNKPENSKIIINNTTLVDTKNNIFVPIHKRQIGYIFQESRLFPHLNVKQNLNYGYNLNYKKNQKFSFNEIMKLLSLSDLLKRYPNSLSGGEKQRVAIGRALLSQPDLLLMDEPLVSLDQVRKDELVSYIAKINEILNIPAIYVSHSISETFILGNKIHFLKSGKLIFAGNRDNSLSFYNKSYNYDFGDSYIKGKVIKVDKSEGLTEINFGKDNLLVFSKALNLGQMVIVKIKSTDIIISKIIPDQISSLNYLNTIVEKILHQNGLICLILKFNQNILKAHLTKKSFNKLNIKEGINCFAIIKALNINDVISISLV